MLFLCWASVVDGGTTSEEHRLKITLILTGVQLKVLCLILNLGIDILQFVSESCIQCYIYS